MCGCNNPKPLPAMNTNEVNAMLEQARQQALSEQDAMVASIAQAAQNANSNVSAQR